jgi:ATP-dependent DNA ligase
VPVLYLTPFDGPEWLFEPKYDGFRGLLYLTGRDCHFRSKRGNVLRGFEHLCYWVREELVERDVILDGEVIALDREGRQPSLRRLRRALAQGQGSPGLPALPPEEDSQSPRQENEHGAVSCL